MVFFTRQLYAGIQPDSGWERRAEREWDRRFKICRRYEALIAPLLPVSVVRLCRATLHDAIVDSVKQKGESLIMHMDARGALGGFRGWRVRLTFGGVRDRLRIPCLVGQWWLYQEAHLSSRAKFNLQVLLSDTELEIEANELSVKKA
jgi:hypothetical protein